MNGFPSPDQILAFGRQANEMMLRLGILPSPENYELWFCYVSQRNEALTNALDQAVREGTATNLDHARVLHARFFGQGSSEVFEEIGIQLNAELAKLSESVGRSGADTAAFDKTLTSAGAELEGGSTDIKSIVQRLTSATRVIQSRNKDLEDQLKSSMTEVDGLRTRMETIRKESLTDALTGLANRRSFDEGARRAIDVAMAEGTPLSLIISDVDHFKKFNDVYGHAIGDQVLRLVAQCLKTNVKGKDLAARFGGEEFVVILPNTKLANAAAVASDIRKTVESKKIVQKSTGKDMGTVTLSLGVAQYVPGEQIADLLNRADACLYAAKRGGRNRVLTELEMGNTQSASGTAVPAKTINERSADSQRFEYAVRAVCRDGAMPLRSQIDLRQFHRFARWMVIAEPDLATRRIPLRLVGSGFHDLVGRDLTGTDYLDLSDPDIRSTAFDGMMSLINHPVALWQQTPIQLPSGKLTTFEYTIFPMLHEKENRHQLLVLVSHQLSDGPALGGVPMPLRSSDWVFLDLGKGFPKLDATAAA